MHLDPNCCRQRQKRLLSAMDGLDLAAAVLSNPKHVLYLTGFLTHRYHRSAVVLEADGRCTLVSSGEPGEGAIDAHVSYKPASLATLRHDQESQVAERVNRLLRRSGRLGLDKNETSVLIAASGADTADLDDLLLRLRRRKDEDELRLLQKAIDVTQAAYARAREVIRPGVSELEVYAELYKAAVLEAGQEVPIFGNDFQCSSPGGPARPRAAEAGELYILDLGPEVDGYFADNCRTFAVNGADETQMEAWRRLVSVFDLVEQRVRPGVSCREMYFEVKAALDSFRNGSFFHHLGHGVGLFPHEQPNLNPHWDHCFEAGDFFTVEPGLYFPELRSGIRLEENYLVTDQGVRRFTTFPLDL